jgi:GNAT superfamily N-acetyltransferase
MSVSSEPDVRLEFLADRQEFVPQIAQWFFTEWGYKQSGNSVEATTERLMQKLHRDKLPLLIVASQGEALLGVAQLKVREMEEFPQYEHWLGSVFVSPEARGYGIAGKMISWASQLAQELGIAKLYLQTEKLDGGLYARAGWQPLEEITSRGDRVLVMVRDLSL